MSYTANEWELTSYTNSTWTVLIDNSSGAQPVIVFSLIVAVGSNSGSVQVARGAGSCIYLPSYAVTTGVSVQLNKGPLVVNVGDKLEVYATASGMNFSAHGAY
jgi:hypothetical protein